MQKAGRKPINADLLKGYAEQWACLLYGVRDGYPGFILLIAGKQTIKVGLTKHYGADEGAKFWRKLRGAKEKLKRDRFPFPFVEPVPPAREIWDRLKNATRPQAIKRVFQMLQKWAVDVRGPLFFMASPNPHPLFAATAKTKAWGCAAVRKAIASGQIPAWPLLPFAISEGWATEIAKAKKLWTYPRTSRTTSDDKRIEFFAKSFAALMLGKSPATVTARGLPRWHWPKDWYNREIPLEWVETRQTKL